MKLNFARNRSLGAGMPDVSEALDGWESRITLIVITQSVVDGDVVQNSANITFYGVWQPLRDDQLQFKPEGQRSWQWIWLHTRTNIELETGDKVIYNHKRYKVMAVKDYGLNQYYEYELVRDYDSGN